MNKSVIAASAVALAVAGAVGGSMVTDKKIKDLYDSNGTFWQENKNISLSSSRVDIGLTGGTASWTAAYIPDLCHDDKLLTLRGEDEIKRGLSGYRILSKIYFVADDGKEIFIGNAETTLGWGGGIDTGLTVPAGSHQLPDGTVFQWGEGKWQSGLSAKDYQGKPRYFVDSYRVSLPEFSVSYENTKFSLKNLMVNGSAPLQAGLIKDGSEEFALEGLVLTGNFAGMPANIALNGLKSSGKVKIGSGKIHSDSQVEAASLSVSGKNYQNIRFNGSLKDLDQAAVQQFIDLMAQQTQRCVSSAETEQALQDIMLAAAKQGFSFESAGSQVELDGSKAAFDGSLNFPAGEYANVQDLAARALDMLTYKMTLSADKSFLQKIGLTGAGGQMSEDDLRMMAGELPPPLKLTEESDQFVLSASKP